MQRLIDADRAKKEILDWAVCIKKPHLLSKDDTLFVLDTLPTIDAVPVVHGRWFLLDECSNAGVYCSVCRKKVYKEQYVNQKLKSKYCPNCGAKMDLEVIDNVE